MRQILSGIATAIVAVVFCAFAIELVTRFVLDDGLQYDLEMWKYARDVKQVARDPALGHEHAPNRHAQLMRTDFKTNSKGLRDREFPYERVAEKRRILMLGDSLTVGWGVEEKETFSKQVEKMYAAKGADIEVINTGVGNYNTVQEVEYFLMEGHKYQPDVVVLNFFVNDAEIAVPAKTPSALMRHCYSCVFVLGQYDAVMRRFFGKVDWEEYYLGLYDEGRSKGWLDVKESIRKLAEYCKAQGIVLLIANHPELHDVGHYHFQSITDLVRRTADQFGVGFVDLLPYLKDQDSSMLWVTPPDPHPNALAHKLLAQGLFDALQKIDNSH
jgi:lysophospholipase L1-like esterase